MSERDSLEEYSYNSEIKFEKINNPQYKLKQYYELTQSIISQLASTGAIIGTQVGTLCKVSDLMNNASNGLFTATVPLEKLMAYEDGTVSSIIKNGGKIVSHEGFSEITSNALKVTKITSLLTIGFQAMAFVSGQYYMHQINKKLESIDSKLDSVLFNHLAEKKGQLEYCYNRLKQISLHEIPDSNDLSDLREITKTSGMIYHEYKLHIEDGITRISELREPKGISRKKQRKPSYLKNWKALRKIFRYVPLQRTLEFIHECAKSQHEKKLY